MTGPTILYTVEMILYSLSRRKIIHIAKPQILKINGLYIYIYIDIVMPSQPLRFYQGEHADTKECVYRKLNGHTRHDSMLR